MVYIGYRGVGGGRERSSSSSGRTSPFRGEDTGSIPVEDVEEWYLP